MPLLQQKKHKIIIVGGGLSAQILLKQTLEAASFMPDMLPLEVEIIESKPSGFSLGIAWDPDSNRPYHAANTYAPLNELENLKTWHDADPRIKSSAAHKPAMRGEVSREHYGRIIAEENKEVIDELRNLGVTVTVTPNTTVTDIKKTDKNYLVITDTARPKPADFVIVATGHWQNKGCTGNPGVFGCPWPASRLENEIDSNQPIAVMGSSLSAVDAILTLAHHAGHFERDGKTKIVHFVPDARNKKFKVISYSPHGMLPTALHYVRDEEYQEHAPPDFLLNKQDTISLDDVFQSLKQSFLYKFPTYASTSKKMGSIAQILHDDTVKPEDLVKAVYEAYEHIGAKKWLKQELARAHDSIDKREIVEWQHFLRSCAHDLERAYNHFSAEDQERFTRHIKPLFSKLAYGMVISNAEEILALMESGHLEVRKLGPNYSLGTKQEGGLKLPGAEVRYDDDKGREHKDYYAAVVKATGDDLFQLQHSSTLMKNLFKSGLVQEILAPFKDQKEGKKAYDEEQASPGCTQTIRRVKNRYYRSAGGIKVDLKNCAAIPAEGEKAGNLYIIGEALAGHFPLLHGFGAMQRSSVEITSAIRSNIFNDRDKEASLISRRPIELVNTLPSTGSNIMAIVTGTLTSDRASAVKDYVSKAMKVPKKNIEIVPDASLPADVRRMLSSGASLGF